MKINKRKKFWNKKKVFITGHTGFKGAWISLFLNELGAKVIGYALKPSKKNNLFLNANLEKNIERSYFGDILNKKKLNNALMKNKPDIIIHMAAQSLVGKSYQDPINTFNTNCIGTVNVLDIARKISNTKLILVTTSDKVYNSKVKKNYNENDELKGNDPYSSSKVCQDNIVMSYFKSFFNNKKSILIARSGNILGGGDFADDRIVPDYFKAYNNNNKLKIRNQHSTRPWQHVLDALNAYLKLIEKFYNKPNKENEVYWNVSSKSKKNISVMRLINILNSLSNKSVKISIIKKKKYDENKHLNISSNKIKKIIKWSNKIGIEETLKLTLDWYLKYFRDKKNSNISAVNQIKNYLYSK